MTSFPTTFSSLPAVSFVVPNLRHDMHDGTIAQADAWLHSRLAAYATWARTHDSLLIVTFDEDDHTQNNQIATIFVGEHVKPGQYAEYVDHYRVLRTVEDAFGLAHLGAAATRSPISDVWR